MNTYSLVYLFGRKQQGNHLSDYAWKGLSWVRRKVIKKHTIYYDLDVSFDTPAGVYNGVITYTAVAHI